MCTDRIFYILGTQQMFMGEAGSTITKILPKPIKSGIMNKFGWQRAVLPSLPIQGERKFAFFIY